MHYLRSPILAALMALILVLTGQTMAVARGATGPAGSMVLCTGTGPITILVDENGQPIGPRHICPDCSLSLFAALGPVQTLLPRPSRWQAVAFVSQSRSSTGHIAPHAQARAPPFPPV